MPECDECGEQVSMPFRCKFCEQSFCSEHRLPENHECEGLREYKDRSRSEGKIGYDAMKEEQENEVDEGVETGLSRIVPEGFSATAAVLGAMAAVFVVSYTVEGFFGAFALDPSRALQEPWRLFTSLFLHAGFLHLMVNSIVLWSFGRQLEEMMGMERFLTVLFVSGLVSSLGITLSGIFLGTGTAVGISGGLFGLVTFLAVVRPEVRVLAFFVVPLKIRQAIGFFAAVDLVNLASQILGFTGPYALLLGPGFKIASAGHLAGVAAGLVFGYIWRERYRRPSPTTMFSFRRVQ